MDQVTIDDEIAAVRLEWLSAEAQLAELLPPGSPVSRKTPTTRGPDAVEDLAAAIHHSEQAHAAYVRVVRRWAGLVDS